MKTTRFPLTFFPAIRETSTVIQDEHVWVCDFVPDIAESYFCTDNIKVKVLREFNGRVLLESRRLLPFKTIQKNPDDPPQTRETKGFTWANPKDITE